MFVSTSYHSRKINLFIIWIEMHLIIELTCPETIKLQWALHQVGRKSNTVLKDSSIVIGDLCMVDYKAGYCCLCKTYAFICIKFLSDTSQLLCDCLEQSQEVISKCCMMLCEEWL